MSVPLSLRSSALESQPAALTTPLSALYSSPRDFPPYAHPALVLPSNQPNVDTICIT